MMGRFPRLSAARAKPILMERMGLTLAQLLEQTQNLPPLETEKFAATGMPKVTAAELTQLRLDLSEVMLEAGYPEISQSVRQQVDRALSIKLASAGLPIGEMLRPDTWAWIAVYLLPNYVQWRWEKNDGNATEERYTGSVVRNALGRLWLRGRVFDRGTDSEDRWGLVNSMPEDATVAVLERTSVASNSKLAREIVERWAAAPVKSREAETLLRDTMVKARIRAALVEFEGIPATNIAAWVSSLLL